MDSDDLFLARLAAALAQARLDYVIIGTAAASLHGVPVMTQDIDIFVRDTEKTRDKIKAFALHMGGLVLTRPAEPMSKMIRAIGAKVPIDLFSVCQAGGHLNLCVLGVQESRLLAQL